MSTRRAAKKTVDYSQFCDELEDYSGDDDDFQDSPNPPPTKRTRSSKPSPKKNSKKTKVLKNCEVKTVSRNADSRQKEPKSARLSVEEKVFNRDLQAALELSQSQSNGTNHDDRGGSADESTENIKDAGASNTEDRATSIAISNHTKDDKIKGEIADNDDDDDDYEVDDDESDSGDSLPSEGSDDEYEVSKGEKKKTTAQASKKPAQTVKSSIAKGASTKTKGKPGNTQTPSLLNSNLKASVAKAGLVKATTAVKPKLSTVPLSIKSTYTPQGNNLTNRTISPGLSRASPSSSLSGVHVRQSNPGGIRLGLSRNIRISKPLHPNASNGT